MCRRQLVLDGTYANFSKKLPSDWVWPLSSCLWKCTRTPSAEICVVDAVPFAADGEIQNGDAIKDNIMLCKRGGTTFVEKVKRAAEAGAVGVIIVNTEDDCLNEKHGFGTHAYPASSLIRGAGASRSSRTSNSLAIERQ